MSDEPPVDPGDPSDAPDDPATAPDEHADADESDQPDERGDDSPDGSDAPLDDDSITEGSLLRPLFRLAWPIVVIQLLQVTYNIVDTLYLGRLSAEAVGAISLAFPLIFLLIAVAGGFTTAGAILVAQYTGADGDGSAGLVAGQTIFTVMVLSVFIGIGGYFYTRPALELLPSDADTAATVIPLAADYMEVIFAGIPLMFGFFVFSALMRGYGDTRTPMAVMFISVLLNVLLDPFFIFGFDGNPLFGLLAGVPGLAALDPIGLEATLLSATGITGLGIRGAALATILSRGVATAIGLWVLFGTDYGPDVTLGHLAPDLDFIRDIFRLGLPSSVEQTTSALAMITLTAMIVTFSPPVVAAYGLGNRLISLVFLPAMGLGRAIDTMVGQNLGANRADRAAKAVKFAATTGAGVMFLVAVVAVAFTEPIVGAFLGDVPDAPATIEYAVEYVRIRSVEFAFIGVSQVILGAFRGAGNTKTAMIISILTLWVGRVASVAYLVFVAGWGETGVWVGMALGNVLGAVVGVAWFARGTWTERYIDDPDPGVDPVGDD
ncbi:Multi antimicrobial extrusion protein (Na(+)/drug antiporter), MATE family of MDR efflux pumps [Halorubrum sp. DM2]|uniref:MATE family efflux transporter n=1 Tax=Halorubrum sp. DM2 TaxID=2527867 RepID=UPI0024B74E1C|nr:MATE family efflux transporter [Halorubrum sp. DM2]VTT85976.1 Multi antimicrobial extrusion protein (Na(+)/drug antiporter), MATE family of MDR efflux pumps [Halorubrum sp. DM2]